jgi:hypothetical protein
MMSYNLRAGAKGRQGRRSNANVVVVASSEAEAVEVEDMDDVMVAASLHETGEHSQRKNYLIRPRAAPWV